MSIYNANHSFTKIIKSKHNDFINQNNTDKDYILLANAFLHSKNNQNVIMPCSTIGLAIKRYYHNERIKDKKQFKDIQYYIFDDAPYPGKEHGPIWDEIQAGRARILEIEKKYFEEFWGMLTPEQRAKYEAMSQKNK